MKLTNKDREFLRRLKELLERKGLEVRLKTDGRGLSRIVLVGRYGDKLGSHLHLTRQGVYWRFFHICEAYISAYESIYFLESTFGISLRDYALQITRERIALRKKALENASFLTGNEISRRQTGSPDANGQPFEK
ncbi:MAG: hypothetical protein WC975_12590 [Phycisphaerae bacterium]